MKNIDTPEIILANTSIADYEAFCDTLTATITSTVIDTETRLELQKFQNEALTQLGELYKYVAEQTILCERVPHTPKLRSLDITISQLDISIDACSKVDEEDFGFTVSDLILSRAATVKELLTVQADAYNHQLKTIRASTVTPLPFLPVEQMHIAPNFIPEEYVDEVQL